MHSMVINRRDFNKALLVGTLLAPTTALAGIQIPKLVSCAQSEDGQNYLAVVDARTGSIIYLNPLPARGHGVVVAPNRSQAAVFARRPGLYIHLVDINTGDAIGVIDAPPNRRFYGHGTFSADGRHLFATENDFENARGVIGIYDTTNGYNRIGEFESFNIGPHEIALMPDDKTLVMANGGIQTHPDKGRDKLNLETMRPSLAYIDSVTGKLIEEVILGNDHRLSSIRHFAVRDDGLICFAMQHQDNDVSTGQLVGLHRQGEGAHILETPFPIDEQMNNYCGSVAFSKGGQQVAVSHPRGNMLSFWQPDTGDFLGSSKLPDGCGLAASPDNNGFIASSGHKGLFQIAADNHKRQYLGSHQNITLQWDNHMVLA